MATDAEKTRISSPHAAAPDPDVPPGYKRTEVGLIPEDWEVVSLGNVAALKNGYAFKSNTYVSDGIYRIITIANVQDGYLSLNAFNTINELPRDLQDHQLLRSGDLLISMTGNVGRVCIVEGEHYLLNQRVGKLVPRGIDRSFLYYIVHNRRFLFSMVERAIGGAQGNLGKFDITGYQCALPKEVAEQRAIAEALSDVDRLIAALDKLIAKKRAIKQAAMQQLLTGKTRLPGFSGEWEKKRLGDVLTICYGKSQHEVESTDGSYPILATGGQIGRARHFLYDKPSVLIGRKGTIDQPQYMETPFWTVDTLFYSVIHEPNHAKFLFYLFCLIDWKQYNEASGVPSLNARTIENIQIKTPSPDEQRAIATILSDMDAEIEALERQRDKVKQIKQGMMQQLLTGRIRLVKPSTKTSRKDNKLAEGAI